ncbi:hypothetical protein TcasGA2_TC034982, partial [Tribolium castaneum]
RCTPCTAMSALRRFDLQLFLIAFKHVNGVQKGQRAPLPKLPHKTVPTKRTFDAIGDRTKIRKPKRVPLIRIPPPAELTPPIPAAPKLTTSEPEMVNSKDLFQSPPAKKMARTPPPSPGKSKIRIKNRFDPLQVEEMETGTPGAEEQSTGHSQDTTERKSPPERP